MKMGIFLAIVASLILTVFQNCGDPLPAGYKPQSSLSNEKIELVSQIPVAGDYAVAEGQEVVLSANFAGSSNMNYQWYNGDTLITAQNPNYRIEGNRLVVVSVPVEGLGVYRVEANGKASSRNVTLRKMGFSVEPIYFNGQLASTVSVNTALTGFITMRADVVSNVESQFLQYSWYRNGGAVVGQNSATLNLPSQIGNAGIYQLAVTNLLTNQVIFSNESRVTVSHSTLLTDFCTDHFIRLGVYNDQIENSQNTQFKVEIAGLGTNLAIGRNCATRFQTPSMAFSQLIPANSQNNRITVTALSPSAPGCNNNMTATHGPASIAGSRQATRNLSGTCSAGGGQFPDITITILAQPPT